MEQPHASLPPDPGLRAHPGLPLVLVELLFFGYRDFVGEADQVLAHYGFGRAHHRVLHFVHAQPGLTVAELLAILDITKQSLARVLRDLVQAGFIEQRPGESDRRQRRLALTGAGQGLAQELLGLQQARIGRALGELSGEQAGAVEAFLVGLIEPKRRKPILQRLQLIGARP